jgi:hypothetical protein
MKAPRSLRRLWYRHRRTCLDCGFLAFMDGGEAGTSARATVAAEGKAGWFQREAAVDCYKRLWNWEDDAPINIIVYETNRLRYGCRGFHRYSPGRSPEAHLKLEDEQRSFRRQVLLALVGAMLALLAGAIGYVIRGRSS